MQGIVSLHLKSAFPPWKTGPHSVHNQTPEGVIGQPGSTMRTDIYSCVEKQDQSVHRELGA